MKRYLILFLVVISFVSSCTRDDDSDMKIREIAWNSIDEQQKETVLIDWRYAPITEPTYEGKRVYAVTFNTSDDPILGPIILYISKRSLAVVGYGARF